MLTIIRHRKILHKVQLFKGTLTTICHAFAHKAGGLHAFYCNKISFQVVLLPLHTKGHRKVIVTNTTSSCSLLFLKH